MTVDEAIRHRRTVRRFRDDPVSTYELREMLTLACQAPNISNRQMWRFIVLTDPTLRQLLAQQIARKLDEIALWPEYYDFPQRMRVWKEMAMRFAEAPATVVFIKQYHRDTFIDAVTAHGMKALEADRLYAYPEIQSLSAVMAFFCLIAEGRGYGACWMTSPLVARSGVEATLQLAPSEEIVAFISLGRPAEMPAFKNRKPIDDLITWR